MVVTVPLLLFRRGTASFVFFFVSLALTLATASLSALIITRDPGLAKTSHLDLFLWLGSGSFTTSLVIIQAVIFSAIIKRVRDESNYHVNFFGKKVLNQKVVTGREMGIFFITVPIFMFSAAYFVGKLIIFIRRGFFI